MKQLVCEMCGGTDLMKQDGAFVCQNCGMKYSVEEAKKMMIEGTVDVQGTVKVDDSGRFDKLLTLARQAKSEGNIGQAGQFYNEASVLRPEDWECNFYSVYYQALDCKVGEVGHAARTIMNRAISTLLLLKDDSSEEAKAHIIEISNAVAKAGDIIYSTARKHQVGTSSQRANADAIKWMSQNFDMLMGVGKIFETEFGNNDIALMLYKKAFLYGIHTNNGKGVWKRPESLEAIKRLEPDFDPKAFDKANKKGGCYVATAVYGSYDCPQVWTLRRYRDYTLAQTWYGRLFIMLYYSISPTLVKWFGSTNWFKKMWKGKLDRMVADLQAKGVESTPYQDKNW